MGDTKNQKKPQMPNKGRTDLQIFVKEKSGNTFMLDVDQEESIISVKYQIQMNKGIPPQEQRVIFNGKQLDDEKTLKQYNIGMNSTVDLFKKLKF